MALSITEKFVGLSSGEMSTSASEEYPCRPTVLRPPNRPLSGASRAEYSNLRYQTSSETGGSTGFDMRMRFMAATGTAGMIGASVRTRAGLDIRRGRLRVLPGSAARAGFGFWAVPNEAQVVIVSISMQVPNNGWALRRGSDAVAMRTPQTTSGSRI